MWQSPTQPTGCILTAVCLVTVDNNLKVIHVFNWEGKNKYPLCDAIDIWRKHLSFFDGSQKLLLEFMPDGKPESLAAETAALKEIRSVF